MEYLSSPLNYTGSKTKLMSQLVSHFPKVVDGFFIDLFCGGLSVTINTNYERYISNDIIKPLIGFYEGMQSLDVDTFLDKVLECRINKSSAEAYAKLRNDFNLNKDPYLLFSLISSCTNNLMRFSGSGDSFKFNQTFGKRAINDSTISKLHAYHSVMKTKDIRFENKTFEQLINENLDSSNFFYFDPPYSSTKEFKIEAGYNCYWTKQNEINLWASLDTLNDAGCKFAVSNILTKNGVMNPSYDKFKKWNIVELDFNYEKVARKKNSEVIEILIKNY